MKNLFDRLRNRTAAFIHDLIMGPLAWFGAYWLRFNLETIPPVFLQKALALLPLIVTVYGCMFVYFGLYRGIWRFASMHDFMRILKAVTMGAALNAALILMLFGAGGVPRSAFILHGLLLVALLG